MALTRSHRQSSSGPPPVPRPSPTQHRYPPDDSDKHTPCSSAPSSAAKSASRPVAVPHSTPVRSQRHQRPPTSMPLFSRSGLRDRRRRPAQPIAPSSSHDPNAISPAVAALLAVTSIPPRNFQPRRKPVDVRQIASIQDLVVEWKNDDSLKSSYGTSPVLGMLLEDSDIPDDLSVSERDGSVDDDDSSHTRSVSCESVPSLDVDDISMFSVNSPSTPGSLRSRKSSSNLRKDRSRQVAEIEECPTDHPLAFCTAHDDQDDNQDSDSILSTPKARKASLRPRSSFKSNLTTSLQALKNAAISSFSSLSLNSNISALNSGSKSVAPFSDEMLWSHPFLFPRLTTEVRPTIHGLPTEAERHYLNPTQLSFEELEAPFQQALHAPFLAEVIDNVPFIPMQTYSRSRRKTSTKRARGAGAANPDPQSEAGRALLVTAGVRIREVRENGDFLRMVVLEMNMRRQGKIETGRAKIWLPPRETTIIQPDTADMINNVPKRWIGESAY